MRGLRCYFQFLAVAVCLLMVTSFILIWYSSDNSSHFDVFMYKADVDDFPVDENEIILAPIILWWTGFTKEPGRYKTCGNVQCFFTANRRYKDHPKLKVFMFYGTDLNALDLPLPHKPHHEWAVLHEESPKNNVLFSFQDMLVLFNHTSTFRRISDYPITTQLLESKKWLLTKKYMKSVNSKNMLQKEQGLAPVVYVHSDCDPPSDRDHYVKLLMKYIPVDSYGACLNNKQLPQHLRQPVESMDHGDFYELLSQYKFALAMENAVCEDYITEKLWRSLMIGTVPVVYGSPSVKDFLPSDHSAIVITDFDDVASLAQYLHNLNKDDDAYNSYLRWKEDGISTPLLWDHLTHRDWSDNRFDPPVNDFITGFECFVCKRVHENLQQEKEGRKPLQHIASVGHYGCPLPRLFDDDGRLGKKGNWRYAYDWKYHEKLASAVRQAVENNQPLTEDDLGGLSDKIGELPPDYPV